jgi:hypothetical protein
MKESLLLSFLYRTVPGRAVLKLLVNPRVSRLGGRFLNSGLSRPMIPYYIAKYGIDMRGIEIPEEEFAEGIAFIFRLTPANYHRYSYAADGRILTVRKIPGVLHCVRPVAVRTIPVYAENSREYQVIDTDRFGRLIQMEVGALLVGKITNDAHREEGSIVWCGDEKGYFEFGGSTILLILKGDVIVPDESLAKRTDANGEVPVRMGEVIARKQAGGAIEIRYVDDEAKEE